MQPESRTSTSMIREWSNLDLPAVAAIMHHLRSISEWGRFPEYDCSLVETIKWLLNTKFSDPNSYCLVYKNDQNDIEASIGVTIEQFTTPPFVTHVREWCLHGNDLRVLSKMWGDAKAWGKRHGALFAVRGTVSKYNQTLRMEKL